MFTLIKENAEWPNVQSAQRAELFKMFEMEKGNLKKIEAIFIHYVNAERQIIFYSIKSIQHPIQFQNETS